MPLAKDAVQITSSAAPACGRGRRRTNARAKLASLRPRPKIAATLIFSAEGPRSVGDRDVIAVYRDNALDGYCHATIITASGEEISGRALTAGVDALERRPRTR
jgi:hypothetical protein